MIRLTLLDGEQIAVNERFIMAMRRLYEDGTGSELGTRILVDPDVSAFLLDSDDDSMSMQLDVKNTLETLT